jgi:Heterokaryon incompatibility protein (HET)
MARGEPTWNTGSKETWDVALQWLQHCKTTHSKCNQTSQANWLPTRVLNVGTFSEPCLRLHITDERPPNSQYITLSHCWGQLQIKRLLKANISEFSEGIDVAELPKTFQDAVVIARRLGIRFLWIDSLCIIQDSEEDWIKESSSMGNVYRNSLCNIAATAAPDGRTGCFLQHNPVLARTCRIRIDGLPGPAPKSKVYDLVQSNFWQYSIDFAPLIRRGWILQERVLAPRVIHYGESQLFWECYELVSACHLPHRRLCYASYV